MRAYKRVDFCDTPFTRRQLRLVKKKKEREKTACRNTRGNFARYLAAPNLFIAIHKVVFGWIIAMFVLDRFALKFQNFRI